MYTELINFYISKASDIYWMIKAYIFVIFYFIMVLSSRLNMKHARFPCYNIVNIYLPNKYR